MIYKIALLLEQVIFSTPRWLLPGKTSHMTCHQADCISDSCS